MAELTLNEQNFEQEVLKSELPAMVDFWAAWCGPCKVLGPVVEEIASEMAGKAVIGKVNVDENPQLTSTYGVMSIPTVLFFKNGAVVETSVGSVAKEVLIEKLNKLM